MDGELAPQNIYDDPAFFAGYSALPRFGQGWTRAFDYPAFMALLPDICGLSVLDLGCGAGQLAHQLAVQGAASVSGVDLSERMLAVARADWAHPRVEYIQGALEDVRFPATTFDLVVSSLAFHYVADYPALIGRVHGWLKSPGTLVFSNEHPIYTGRSTPDGWHRDAAGEPLHWAVDQYGVEGVREQNWLAQGVRKYHRTMDTLVNTLLDTGFTLERLVEPIPDAATLAERPEFAEGLRFPTFLLLRARKP